MAMLLDPHMKLHGELPLPINSFLLGQSTRLHSSKGRNRNSKRLLLSLSNFHHGQLPAMAYPKVSGKTTAAAVAAAATTNGSTRLGAVNSFTLQAARGR
jgi:hypothetical protein